MQETKIPAGYEDMVGVMRADHEQILAALAAEGYEVEDYPDLAGQGRPQGAAAAKAYPIQGVLKYHGMTDWEWRTTYLPSISFNNDAAYSLTYVAFDGEWTDDVVVINGEEAGGRDLERVQQTLDVVRKLGGVKSGARVWSRNIVRATQTGKGLGTSASASAAVAMAAVAAMFGEEAAGNNRFVSCLSRLLAGSGCRSAAGGLSLWVSYPGIAHEDSWAVRLDDRGELDEVQLITVPINSRIGLKTELAHQDAPHSPLYKEWMRGRLEETLELMGAVRAGEWQVMGQLAELDSIRLHGVTMSGSRENKIFAWEPENIYLFRMCNELRLAGVPVYFSTDTGPTVVFMTHQDYTERVVAAIEALDMGFETIVGRIAGPTVLVDIDEARDVLDIPVM
ncbi:MAG TPA: GHMP kinase [Anaerolineae bacterium]|nr:GHMP kinase [Anaerolineae bacterium]